jgi:hypothetical protein
MRERRRMFRTELTGLDGSNLLAYMASLGVLRLLSRDGVEVRMEWEERGSWTPVLWHSAAESSEAVLDLLEPLVCGEATVNPAWTIRDDLTLSCVEFGQSMWAGVASAGNRDRAGVDFLAAFGADVYGAGTKKEAMSDTAFRTMSGAGHQHFLGFMRELAAGTEREHLRRTLFSEWDYADGRPSLRWDPADYRPHALRAVDPSTDPIRTMRGANRLAVEALPLFPTMPVGRRIRTVAFRDGEDGTELVWPIWTDRLELGSVASLLASRLEAVRPGVAQVYRATRFTEGKYRNFSPSKAMF